MTRAPLKPGERILVYWTDTSGRAKTVKATVKAINETGAVEFETDSLVTDHAHPKQCRRLKKRGSREIWVNCLKGASPLAPHEIGVAYTDRETATHLCHADFETVHFREVRERKDGKP